MEDKRRKDWEPKTPFQRWLKPFLKVGTPEEISFTEIARRVEAQGVEVSENYIYRIVRGDPETFKNAARPGYDMALAIGQAVGDPENAVLAAGYALPSGEAPGGVIKPGIRRRLSNGDVVIIDPDEPDPDRAAAEMEMLLAGYRAGRYGTAGKD